MRCGPAVVAAIVNAAGSSRPPPSPCATRKTMSAAGLHATAHSTEPATNPISATKKTRRTPKRSMSQPDSGIVVPAASRYAEVNHTAVCNPVPRSAAIVCKLAVTMVPSTTAISAASATVSTTRRLRRSRCDVLASTSVFVVMSGKLNYTV